MSLVALVYIVYVVLEIVLRSDIFSGGHCVRAVVDVVLPITEHFRDVKPDNIFLRNAEERTVVLGLKATIFKRREGFVGSQERRQHSVIPR